MNRSLWSQFVGTLILTGSTFVPVLLVGLILQGLQNAWA